MLAVHRLDISGFHVGCKEIGQFQAFMLAVFTNYLVIFFFVKGKHYHHQHHHYYYCYKFYILVTRTACADPESFVRGGKILHFIS